MRENIKRFHPRYASPKVVLLGMFGTSLFWAGAWVSLAALSPLMDAVVTLADFGPSWYVQGLGVILAQVMFVLITAAILVGLLAWPVWLVWLAFHARAHIKGIYRQIALVLGGLALSVGGGFALLAIGSTFCPWARDAWEMARGSTHFRSQLLALSVLAGILPGARRYFGGRGQLGKR